MPSWAQTGLLRWLRWPFWAAAFSLLLTTTAALADKRVALVIGESAYRNVAMLPNPERDAAAIAKLFRDAGFDNVVEVNNVGNLDFKRAIRRFEDASADADIAVVFYAGHGIEIGGVNYLIPVDAILARDRDARDEAIALDRLIEAVEGAGRLRLIILDACRDNPFGKRIRRMIAVRGVSPGLGKVEPSSSDTLIAYAAKAGSTAEDGSGAHSPFTRALLDNLTTPGLDIRLAFGRVRDEVMKMTHNRQEPYVYGSLGGKTAALVPDSKPIAPAAPSVESVVRDYEFAHDIGTAEAWESFMAAHPASGYYYNLARAALDKLNSADDRANRDAQRAAAEKARLQAAAKRRAEEDAIARAQAQAKSEAELRRKADAEAKRQAEAGAKRKAEEQAKAQAEAKRKAQEQAKAQAENQAKAEAQAKLQADLKRKADEEARLRAEQETKTKLAEQPTKSEPPTVIAMAPANEVAPKPEQRAIDPRDLASLLQVNLKRVGCDPGALDGTWNDKTSHAMELFNRGAHTNFDVKVASLGALEAVKAKQARVCPLVCGKGQEADGDRCVAAACKRGTVRNKDGECVRDAKPAARPSKTAEAPSAGQQVFCARGGCRTLPKNCHLNAHSNHHFHCN